jgi:hypothetical protein
MRRSLLARAACVVMATVLAGGCVYVDVQRPLDTNFEKTELGAKEGRASSRSVLWLVAWGDAGSKAAADDGGIEIITHADREVFSILGGLYSRSTTVVYGN